MWKPNPECNTKFVEIKNKPTTIMRPICEYCKRCQKKPTAIMGTICGYCNEWRMSATIQLVKVSTGVGIATKPQNSSW